MGEVLEVPVWFALLAGLAAAIGVTDRVIAPSLRWWLRRRLLRAVDRVNDGLQLDIQPFKLIRRKELVDRLTYDPDVAKAVEAYSAETGMPRDIAIGQAAAYAREICPSFSAHMYFGVGARISKWICRSLYRVRLGSFDQAELDQVDRTAAVVFVMNHKSNLDYLLVTYLAAQSSALSYAVGEWAQVWPLNRLIRSMGAYFIRRRDRDALYKAVLRRYIELAVEGGVAQAIFPEGGLSRDGSLGAPKLGLISYIVEGFDPEGPRDVIFVPVGLNYDRVLEDRILMGAQKGADGKARFRVSLLTSAGFVGRVIWGRLTGRMHRFGYACVGFGAPLSLRAFLASGEGDRVAALGAELASRIGRMTPVLPTPLIARLLLSAEAPVARADLSAKAAALAEALRGTGAYLHIPRDDFDYGVEVGLRMLTLRHIVEERAGLLHVADRPGLEFYANSIRHLDAPAV